MQEKLPAQTLQQKLDYAIKHRSEKSFNPVELILMHTKTFNTLIHFLWGEDLQNLLPISEMKYNKIPIRRTDDVKENIFEVY